MAELFKRCRKKSIEEKATYVVEAGRTLMYSLYACREGTCYFIGGKEFVT